MRAARYDEDSRSYDALYADEQLTKLEAALGAGWKARGRLVDFGCGTALLTSRLARGCDAAVGVDVSIGMLRLAKRRRKVDLVLADASWPPLRPGAFDSLVCFTSFQNFRRKREAMKGMVACLQEDGSAVFSLLWRGEAANDEPIVLRQGGLALQRRLKAGNDSVLLMTKRRAP